MSVLRPLLSRRGRLVLAAAALLLMSALIVAPSVSGARAAVKQFTATIDPGTAIGGVAGTWTEEVKNCGTPVAPPCTASSTIAIGQIRTTVPPEFRATITLGTVTTSSGQNWTASYNSGTGVIVAQAVTGSDKLASGEFVDIPFTATPECLTGPKEFTTTAVGGLPNGPNNQTFSIVSPQQPSVTIAGCQLASGGSVTDPVTGQTETLSGDFQGHVNITFDGTLIDCGFDSQFGNQWSHFQLPAQVNITPADDFVANGPKISTSTFTPVVAGDSSSYLICWAALDSFATRSGESDVQTIDGTDFFVGILPNCYNPVTGDTRPEPCVSEQFLNLTTNKIVISVRTPPGDPHKR